MENVEIRTATADDAEAGEKSGSIDDGKSNDYRVSGGRKKHICKEAA